MNYSDHQNLRNTIESTKSRALERREAEEKSFAEEVRTCTAIYGCFNSDDHCSSFLQKKNKL